MRFALLTIPCLIVLAGCSTTHKERNTASQEARPTYGADQPASEALDRLIVLSASVERDEWWPAVTRLGRQAADDEELRDEIWERARVNSLGMKFAEIPSGAFSMGPDVHRLTSVTPAYTVRITRPFCISVTEVTNVQFEQLSPQYQRDWRYSPADDSPAVRVSWDEAGAFCEALSRAEGAVYRLPTEAEWEYACRAGTTTKYHFGDDPADLHLYAWYNYVNGRASPVALLKPNDWGLYDMHGNAWEWVSDRHSVAHHWSIAKQLTAMADPKGPALGFSHVLRGGGWQVRRPEACNSTVRIPMPVFNRPPFSRDVGIRETVGFRVVRVEQKVSG